VIVFVQQEYGNDKMVYGCITTEDVGKLNGYSTAGLVRVIREIQGARVKPRRPLV